MRLARLATLILPLVAAIPAPQAANAAVTSAVSTNTTGTSTNATAPATTGNTTSATTTSSRVNGTSSNVTPSAQSPVGAEPGGPAALQALVRRRLPAKYHDVFGFVIDPAVLTAGQHDAYTIKPKTNGNGNAYGNGQGNGQGNGNGNGKGQGQEHGKGHNVKVVITSSTTSGLSRGLLAYLRSAGGDIYWSGDNFSSLPDPLSTDLSGHSWAQLRYFLNVVTFSYTTAFYGWDKWEYLLDWSALHGFNLLLSSGGQEYILAEMLKDFGLTHDEVLQYITGPAFHGWSRQQNIRGSWGGTTPQEWLDAQWDLQKKIVARMVALGMTPILPGFMGSLPAKMHDIIGGLSFRNASKWMGFPDQYTGNTALDPTWPTWKVVEVAFLEKQKELYGNWTSGYYSIDLYTEMRPPSTDAAYLKANAQAVVDSIRAVDPKGVWVINGWLFVNDGASWTTDAINNWIGSLANDAVLILDLASESMPQWRRAKNYVGKPWMWNTLLNYGQNYGFYGALEHYNSELSAARREGGNLVGAGLTMEGINQNEHLFEMASDAPWSETQIVVEDWKTDWIKRRYGALPAAAEANAQEAWTTLDKSVYNSNDLAVKCTTRSVFDLVPNTAGTVMATGNYLATKITYDVKEVVRALDSLLAAADATPALEKVPAFSNDLVDVARQVLLDAGIPWYIDLIAAWKAGNKTGVEENGKRIVEMLHDLDTVLATDKNYLLSTWIADARTWGTTDAQKDFMEFQARNQLVLWGPATYSPWPLDRYAAKHWHGVVGDVFATSWDMFYKYLLETPPASFKYATWTGKLQAYEQQWEQQKWGASNQPWGTDGTPVAAVKAARAKWAVYL